MRGLHQRRAAERAAAAAGTAAGQLYEPDPDCCVCYETLDKPNAVVTECGHVYHRACIENAFLNSRQSDALRAGHGGNCPICRQWIDRASLIKINNGLPTRRDFEIAKMEIGQGMAPVVVDLDSAGGGGCELTAAGCESDCQTLSPGSIRLVESEDEMQEVGFGGGGKPAGEPRKRRRRRRVPTADEAARAMDVEISAALKRGNSIMEKCLALVAMERALKDEVEVTQKRCEAAAAEAAAARKQAADEIGRVKVELRVREMKVQEIQKAAFDDRRELADQIAVARQRNDELLIQIKNGEQAVVDANEEKARAEEARSAQEARRERFSKLAASYEAKRAALGVEKEKLSEFERENKSLRKQVDALRKQVRRATNQPPPPPQAAARSKCQRQSPGDSGAAMLDMDIVNAFIDRGGTKGGGGGDGSVDNEGGGAGDGSGAEEEDDDDDDIVAAADAQFNKSLGRRRESEARAPAEPSPGDRVKFAQGVFGELQAPLPSAAPTAAAIRPPPPPSLRRRGRQGGGGFGLAAFRPPDAAPPPKPGAIGAPRSQVVKTLGQKRSFASPMSALGRPAEKRAKPTGAAARPGSAPATKKRNSKINSFFQSK